MGAGDVVRWEALSSAGSGALQQKRGAEPPRGACKRAKSSPDLSQPPLAADAAEDVPLFSKHILLLCAIPALGSCSWRKWHHGSHWHRIEHFSVSQLSLGPATPNLKAGSGQLLQQTHKRGSQAPTPSPCPGPALKVTSCVLSLCRHPWHNISHWAVP